MLIETPDYGMGNMAFFQFCKKTWKLLFLA